MPHRPIEHRRARPMLGTLVEVSSLAGDAVDRAGFDQACDAAFERIAIAHGAMSLHDPDSDLSRLARAQAGQVVTLRSCTVEVLRLASWVEKASAGVFNAAACAPALAARGLLPAAGTGRPPEAGSLLKDLEWLPGQGRGGGIGVRLLRRVWIDLGGIAKGWAVDSAVQAMRHAGLRAGMVNAGGDLRVFGAHAQAINVRHPGCEDQLLPLVSLAEGAMATTAFQRGELPEAGHGTPAWPRAVVRHEARPYRPDGPSWPSVSVLAPTCALADALTKVLMIMGPDAAPVLRQCGADGIGLGLDGRIHHV